MPLVEAFLSFGSEIDPKQGSYYSNMTGFWHGDTHLHNLTALNASEAASSWRYLSEQFLLPVNLSAIPNLLGPWNWTATNKLSLSVGDKLIPFEHDGDKHNDIAVIHVRAARSQNWVGDLPSSLRGNLTCRILKARMS